jgi:hypothetical protein
MLSKCANPGCTASFLYLHQGKLFRFEVEGNDPAGQASSRTTRNLEFFWLCDECSATLTVSYQSGVGGKVAPLSKKPLAGKRSRATSAS